MLWLYGYYKVTDPNVPLDFKAYVEVYGFKDQAKTKTVPIESIDKLNEYMMNEQSNAAYINSTDHDGGIHALYEVSGQMKTHFPYQELFATSRDCTPEELEQEISTHEDKEEL